MLKAGTEFFQPGFIDKLAIDKAGQSIVFQFPRKVKGFGQTNSHIVRIRHRHKESGNTKESLHSAFICLCNLSCVKPASCLHHHDGNARYQASKTIPSITMTATPDIKLAKLYPPSL